VTIYSRSAVLGRPDAFVEQRCVWLAGRTLRDVQSQPHTADPPFALPLVMLARVWSSKAGLAAQPLRRKFAYVGRPSHSAALYAR
jgi:hypothetical protein